MKQEPNTQSLIGEIERLRDMLIRCSDDLEAEINGRYPAYLLEYPHNQQKKANDMESVIKARAILRGMVE